MELNREHLIDAIEAGNFAAVFPFLRLAVRNRKELPEADRKANLKLIRRLQSRLINKSWRDTFGEDPSGSK